MSRIASGGKFPPNGRNFSEFSRSVHGCGQKERKSPAGMKGGLSVANGNSLKSRIQQGQIRREDVTRRLAELAFGQPNDCVRLALEEMPDLKKLDLSLLSEIKRNEKGMVEIKLVDRLRALEQLAQSAGTENEQVEQFLQALQSAAQSE